MTLGIRKAKSGTFTEQLKDIIFVHQIKETELQ